eukprot:gene20155-26889_t
MSSEFDPRRHSAVAFNVSERQPNFWGSKSTTTPMKSFMVGPHAPDKVCSLRAGARPSTAPARGRDTQQRQNSDAHPKFLNVDGQWVQHRLPTLIADSPAQEMCATGTLKADVTGRFQGGGTRTVKPLTAIHTYNDISPVTTAEHVRDGPNTDLVSSQRIDAATNLEGSATTDSPYNSSSKVERSDFTLKATPIGSTDARVQSIDKFWNRLNGSYNLGVNDIERVEELGRNVVPGTPNTRLVNGRWRYIPRPVDGDVTYTDYYGRYGDEHCNYYGRRYNLSASQYQNNSLVGDADYTKVQASMGGIHTLRYRPGLSLDTTIATSIPSKNLDTISPYAVSSQPVCVVSQPSGSSFVASQPSSASAAKQGGVEGKGCWNYGYQ